ncbi:hypothetical protein TorRG33x02_219670, partial [Trema orientale]
ILKGLCGFPLSKSCGKDADNEPALPTSQQEDSDDEHTVGFDWKACVQMGYGSGIVIGIQWD